MYKIYRTREEVTGDGVYREFTHKFLLECFDQKCYLALACNTYWRRAVCLYNFDSKPEFKITWKEKV